MSPLCIHRILTVTFSCSKKHSKVSQSPLCAKMYRACVGQCQGDSQRWGRGRVSVCIMLCHRRSLHRLSSTPSLPPSFLSATHSPSALDHLLPVQRFLDRILSNHWMRCFSALCVYEFAPGCDFVLSLCRQLPACSLRV